MTAQAFLNQSGAWTAQRALAEGAGAATAGSGRPARVSPLGKRVWRGLTEDDLPHASPAIRKQKFIDFRFGWWPPKHWQVPPDLEGEELKRLLDQKALNQNTPKGETLKVVRKIAKGGGRGQKGTRGKGKEKRTEP